MLENLRKWWQSQKLKIQQSNDQPYLTKISELETENLVLNHEIEGLYGDIALLEQANVSLEDELVEATKHATLEEYRDWLEANIEPKARYYDFGSGTKRVHTIFADSIKDEDIIKEFIVDDLQFDMTNCITADDLVYKFNVALSKKYPTSRYYASDSTLYGTMEYWATAKETIEKLRTGNKSFDCDDSMTLRYSCLYYLLEEFFPDNLWRLRGFIVDIWTGGGHAMLGWVKEGVNDWVPIETTFYDTKASFIWNNNYVIGTQMLYQIRYSFDNNFEYVR